MSPDSDSPGPTSNADTGGRTGGGGDFSTGLRAGLAAALGHSGHQRDRYDVFGWEKEPTADEYYGLYLRNPYAYAAVAQKASTTWRDNPEIVDGVHPEDADPAEYELTDFEKKVNALDHEKDVWSYANRVDRLAGIGTHGILVLDLDDTDGPEDFAEPPELSDPDAGGRDGYVGLDALRGFRVYSASSIEDIKYGDAGTDRWGMPEMYQVDLEDEPVEENTTPDTQNTIYIHHDRVVDVPSRRLDDDETHARPRIELVLNIVYDIEKSLGAAAELAYAGAKQDIHINFDPEKVNADQVTNNNDELQNWYHDREPWIRTVGGEVNQISPPEIVDPSGVINSELKAFSAATDIPQQMLDGSAAGEVAGAEQNERDYFGTIGERREQYATPHIARAIIDALESLGILPSPEGKHESIGRAYRVDWPDLTQLSEADIAQVRNNRAQVVKRLKGSVPELSDRRAEKFVETGEFPERADEGEGEGEVEPIDTDALAGMNPDTDDDTGEGDDDGEGEDDEPDPPGQTPGSSGGDREGAALE